MAKAYFFFLNSFIHQLEILNSLFNAWEYFLPFCFRLWALQWVFWDISSSNVSWEAGGSCTRKSVPLFIFLAWNTCIPCAGLGIIFVKQLPYTGILIHSQSGSSQNCIIYLWHPRNWLYSLWPSTDWRAFSSPGVYVVTVEIASPSCNSSAIDEIISWNPTWILIFPGLQKFTFFWVFISPQLPPPSLLCSHDCEYRMKLPCPDAVFSHQWPSCTLCLNTVQ